MLGSIGIGRESFLGRFGRERVDPAEMLTAMFADRGLVPIRPTAVRADHPKQKAAPIAEYRISRILTLTPGTIHCANTSLPSRSPRLDIVFPVERAGELLNQPQSQPIILLA